MKAKIGLTPADLMAMEQLKRVAARRCRANQRREGNNTKHPHCNRDDAHLLALAKPELIPECPECGEVWKKEVPGHA